MVEQIEIICTIVLLIYSIWLLIMLYGWNKISKTTVNTVIEDIPNVSVIVPFRNESQNLPQLISSLAMQMNTPNKWEVILVDDHSEDNFKSIFLPANFQIISLEKGEAGKKSALKKGINVAKYEVIMTTDADCEVPINWLNLMVNGFVNKNIQMVFGGVKFKAQSGFFSLWQTIEFAPIIGVAAASNYFHLPLTCNGANLAFRKKAYLAVDGYEKTFHIPSGDDEFLLYKLSEKYPDGVIFCKCKDAVVSTQHQKSLHSFIQQKKRWASKWKLGKSLYKKSLAIAIVLSAVSFIFLMYSALFLFSKAAVVMVCSKVIIDAIFIYKIIKFLNTKFFMSFYLISQLIYPFYAIIMAVVANIGTYDWKGRRIKLGGE